MIFAFLLLALLTQEIQLQDELIKVEVARHPYDRSRGLMGRTRLPENTGMLFVFEKPEYLSFWMKGTLIPLSIAFFDEHRRLINIEEMQVPKGKTLPEYRSRKKALYALEMSARWFEEHRIKPGTIFEWKENGFLINAQPSPL